MSKKNKECSTNQNIPKEKIEKSIKDGIRKAVIEIQKKNKQWGPI